MALLSKSKPCARKCCGSNNNNHDLHQYQALLLQHAKGGAAVVLKPQWLLRRWHIALVFVLMALAAFRRPSLFKTRPARYNGDVEILQRVKDAFVASLKQKQQQQEVGGDDNNDNSNHKTTSFPHNIYKPSKIEKHVYDRSHALGFQAGSGASIGMSKACPIWTDASVHALERNKDAFDLIAESEEQEATAEQVYQAMQEYRKELSSYWSALEAYSWIQDQGIVDIRQHLHKPGFCQRLEVDPDGRTLKKAFFSQSSNTLGHQAVSSSLSFTDSSGFVEPLLPPMRSPEYCFHDNTKATTRSQYVVDTDYLIQDFAYMCQHSLKPHSRIVLLDIGASPHYAHRESPWFKIMDLFQTKFGFRFDHIYAYEITPMDTADVYDMYPKEWHAALHWINSGVTKERGHALHPWTLLERDFTEDDFIIVKLDIDRANVEVPLAFQLLESDKLVKLVDQFYFEHHVQMEEHKWHWQRMWSGSIQETLDLFYLLRSRGVPAHFWV